MHVLIRWWLGNSHSISVINYLRNEEGRKQNQHHLLGAADHTDKTSVDEEKKATCGFYVSVEKDGSHGPAFSHIKS